MQGTPAGGQQGEAAFTEGALATLKRVVGQVIDREYVPVAGLLVRDVDALAGALVAAVSEGRQVQLRCCPVQSTEQVSVSGGGQIVIVTGDYVGGPDRLPVRTHDRLNVPAEGPVFPGVPGEVPRCSRTTIQ